MKAKKEDKPVELKSLKDVFKMVEIVPEKDFRITHNQWDIELKEGIPVAIPRKFLQNMVTEGIIKKLPKEG